MSKGPGSRLWSSEDKSRVAQTLRLAEQLGADTLELSGDNVPELIIDYAKQFNASKIIIGKPLRARWREIIFGSGRGFGHPYERCYRCLCY